MFAGMAVFLIVIPLNGYMMKLIERADDERMEEKDKRIKLMNEILSGIKVEFTVEPRYLELAYFELPLISK